MDITSPFLLECAKQGEVGRFEVLLIERTAPPPDVARRLKLAPDQESVLRHESACWADDPVLDVLHTSIDTDGEPCELTRFVMRADLSELRYDAPGE